MHHTYSKRLVRVLDPDPISKTRLQMGEARAQADSLSQDDGVPDLTDRCPTKAEDLDGVEDEDSASFAAAGAWRGR